MKQSAVLLLCLAACLSVSAPVRAIGAIAVDDDQKYTAPAWGFAVGYPTREAAEKRALAFCREHSSDCRAVVWFETCGAYAYSRETYGIGWGATKDDARNKALSSCGSGSCKVLVAECEG